MRGSPIRTSSDQRSVGSSPRLNAASHVLHRLLVPRHPPCALNNLATQKTPHNERPEGHLLCGPTTLQNRERRCSRPLCSSQGTDRPDHRTATHNHHQAHTRHGRRMTSSRSHRPTPRPRHPEHPRAPEPTVRTRSEETGNPAPSGPNSVPTTPSTPTTRSHPPSRRTTGCTNTATTPETELVSVPPMSTRPEHPSDNWPWTPRRTAMPDAP